MLVYWYNSLFDLYNFVVWDRTRRLGKSDIKGSNSGTIREETTKWTFEPESQPFLSFALFFRDRILPNIPKWDNRAIERDSCTAECFLRAWPVCIWGFPSLSIHRNVLEMAAANALANIDILRMHSFWQVKICGFSPSERKVCGQKGKTSSST